MTRARDLAEQANNNVWLIFIQRVMSVVIAPLCIIAVLSYMSLRDRVTLAEAELIAQKRQVASLEATALALRTDLTIHAGNVTRLQAQREGDVQVVESVTRLRSEMREDIQRLNARLDQMMTPPRRGAP